jgi:hypothetical protein
MDSTSQDRQIRIAAFHWLNERKLAHGEVFSRAELQAGFLHEGEHVGIVGPKGIFNAFLSSLRAVVDYSTG